MVDTGSQISPLRIADILRLWGHGEDVRNVLSLSLILKEEYSLKRRLSFYG